MEADLVRLAAYLFAIYAGGRAATAARTSPVVGYVGVGAAAALSSTWVPARPGLSLAGLLGVQLSVIDAGLATPLSAAAAAVPRATAVAVVGLAVPAAGVAVVAAGGWGWPPLAAVAAGAAVAPTSLGVAASLLAAAGELSTPLGTLIGLAAVVDDVLSLVLLAEVEVLAEAAVAGGVGKGVSGWNVARPMVLSAAFVVGGGGVAAAVAAVAATSPVTRDDAAVAAVLTAATLATWAASTAGTSFLLGGYMVGIAAAAADLVAPTAWATRTAPLTAWLLRLFFGATIAFAIPVQSLGEGGAAGRGAALGAVAFVGKAAAGLPMLVPGCRRRSEGGGRADVAAAVVCGGSDTNGDGYSNAAATVLSTGDKTDTLPDASHIGVSRQASDDSYDTSDESDGEEDRLADAVGVAITMENRGEFGFLIATSAAASGVLPGPAAAAVVWAVLGNTLVAPLLFRPVFAWRARRRHDRRRQRRQQRAVTAAEVAREEEAAAAAGGQREDRMGSGVEVAVR
ncbi:hypothetical protein MMPV_005850 [Pyropia vietnamensis]